MKARFIFISFLLSGCFVPVPAPDDLKLDTVEVIEYKDSNLAKEPPSILSSIVAFPDPPKELLKISITSNMNFAESYKESLWSNTFITTKVTACKDWDRRNEDHEGEFGGIDGRAVPKGFTSSLYYNDKTAIPYDYTLSESHRDHLESLVSDLYKYHFYVKGLYQSPRFDQLDPFIIQDLCFVLEFNQYYRKPGETNIIKIPKEKIEEAVRIFRVN